MNDQPQDQTPAAPDPTALPYRPRVSPLARHFDPGNVRNYSPMQVLRSPAGYYIGTTYAHPADSECAGMVEPGTRDSCDYYATREEAEIALRDDTFIQRDHP